MAVLHRAASGGSHWAVEVAVDPAIRPAMERTAIELAMGLVAEASVETTLWCFRPGQMEAASELGFTSFREVLLLESPLPVAPAGERAGYRIRRFEQGRGDAALVASLNNRAFAGHRENDAMRAADVEDLLSAPESTPSGVLIAERAEDGDPAGFCWTTVPRPGVGEIFLIGLVPEHQGSGVGSWLLRSGLNVLAAERGADMCQLWTDADNEAAVRLYRDHGFELRLANHEMRRDQPNG